MTHRRFTPSILLALGCLALSHLAAAQPPTIVATQPAHTADSLLTAAALKGFTGVVLVARDGNVVLRKAYGMANAANNIAFATNTVVQIGSNTKDFTAVAIMQLVQRKLLSVNDSLPKFFANVPPDKRGITVNQLLDHRAGLKGEVGGDFDPINREQLIGKMLATPLESPPGQTRKYSNLGYSVLAAIIELKSGLSYDAYVRDNILQPLSLRSTGYLLPAFDTQRLAHGYSSGQDRGTMLMRPHMNDGHYWNLRGNGGMLSTVDDMLEFYRVLFNSERLLPTELRRARFSDGPAVLAGSDMVNVFMYHREPGDKLEIILSSTTAETRVPEIERQLAEVFGVRPPPRAATVSATARPADIPATTIGRVVKEYITVFNTDDAAARTRFLTERVIAAPEDKRTVAERVARMVEMRGDLGPMIPRAYTEESAVKASVQFVTSSGDTATLEVEIEAGGAGRIVSLRLRVE